MTPLPGPLAAQHRVIRYLGAGPVAEVYEVETLDGRRCALKLSLPGIPRKAEARLGQEGEAVAMIEHVNVVRFHDAGIVDDRVWLLLELVDGPDLRTLARRAGGALPVDRAVRLLRQAAEGVAAAHAQGVLHRDLRPENILVTADDLAKVSDFGAAKLEGWGVQTTQRQDSSSSLYAAPEYMLRRPFTPAADVYAMALMLYELVTGIHPFASSGASALEICKNHLAYEPPPLATLGRGFPGDLSDLLRRSVAKDPEQRPSMLAFAAALATALHHLDAPRRAAARNLALPDRELGLAKTVPLRRAHDDSDPPWSDASLPLPFPEQEACRAAWLPPVPLQEAPRSLPVTQSWSVAQMAAPIVKRETPPTLIMMPERPERASTTAPVERASARVSATARPSSRWPWVLGACAVVLAGTLTVGWALVGSGDQRALRGEPVAAGKGRAAPPSVAAVSASGTSPLGSASAPSAKGVAAPAPRAGSAPGKGH